MQLPLAHGIRHWRFAIFLYWGGATILIPWIIILSMEQPSRGYAYNLALVGGGIVLVFAASAIYTGMLYQRRSAFALMAATFTATLTFITAWFTLTVFVRHLGNTFIYAMVIYGPTVLFLAWVAILVLHASTAMPTATARESLPRWVPWLCYALPIVILPWSLAVLVPFPAAVELHRLRIAWIGLDLYELAAMIAIGFFIRHGSPKLVIAATAFGTLLCCDAWFDVLTSTGFDQLLGLALAFVELPLALYSFVLATQVVRSWGTHGEVTRLPERELLHQGQNKGKNPGR